MAKDDPKNRHASVDTPYNLKTASDFLGRYIIYFPVNL